MTTRWHRARERLTLFLPVALMGLLALGSWWLVRSAPRPIAPSTPQPLRHEPDYFMRGFSIKTFDAQGALKTELAGALAQHYPDTDTLEVDDARMRSVDEQGRETHGSARRALSNADGSEVQLMGDARVTRQAHATGTMAAQPQLQFRGEFLHVWVDSERLHSDQPVTLARGLDTLSGDRMDYDHLNQTLRMDGKVRALLQPRGAPR